MTLRDSAARKVEDTSIFASDLIVLRKVDKGAIDPAAMQIIAETDLLPHLQEKQMPWFSQGFVANDHPRDIFVSEELVKHTEGFAVARSDNGEILREYDGPNALVKAESAASRGKVRVEYNIDIEDDIPVNMPPIPETVLDPEPEQEPETTVESAQRSLEVPSE